MNKTNTSMDGSTLDIDQMSTQKRKIQNQMINNGKIYMINNYPEAPMARTC
jgi:hypothetical protein